MLSFLDRALDWLSDLVLLCLRLVMGVQFYQAGYGKLTNIQKPIDFFTSLGIPLPTLNAYMAGGVECIGGALLALGLVSRPAAFPLSFTMLVAYVTADREALMNVFKAPDGFSAAAPYSFLVAAAVVAAFGPGMLSVDALGAWLARTKLAAHPELARLFLGRRLADRILPDGEKL